MRSHEDDSLDCEPTIAGKPRRHMGKGLLDAQMLGGRDVPEMASVLADVEVVDLQRRYTIERLLGAGGMGAVHLATDTRLHRRVAIKRILGDATHGKAAIRRFVAEARAIAALNHPNIVQIHDYGQAEDGPFLIMEYVDGGDLLTLSKAGPVSVEQAVELTAQLCDGLAKVHDLGIIHRDIKPANVLLTRDGIPKLTDFGLAKAESLKEGQTTTGTVFGTSDFMPPEQRWNSTEVDHRSDLWSLAAMFYQLVTGKSPRVIRLHELPQVLQPILTKALEDTKNARFQSAREFRDALRHVEGAAAPQLSPRSVLAAGELREGQCRACGTITQDLTRKYCRNARCGSSLRVPCFNCDVQIPVWDGVCGDCGGNQPQLAAALRFTLEGKRAAAEELIRDFHFKSAIELADEVRSRDRPEVADLAQWGRSFREAASIEQNRLLQMVKLQSADARSHAAAFDYPAAIVAIEKIPEPLRDESIVMLFSTCVARHEESSKLLTEISQRIKARELEGLLSLVERAVTLRGDRSDLVRIREQLAERLDNRLARAKAALAAGDVQTSADVLRGAVAADLGQEGTALLQRVQHLTALESRLADLVREAKSEGISSVEVAEQIVRVGREYLALNSRNPKVQSLVGTCTRIAGPEVLHSSTGIELRKISTGTFFMGDIRGTGDEEERPAHEVTLSRGYYIGTCPVTNEQWSAVMGNVPSKWKTADHPVTNVTWEEAVEFCQRLSALPVEQKAGRVYRLPTEAEWEFACRAGTTTEYSFGNDESRLGVYAWFNGNSAARTQSVGRKKPNAWGLYDMHGNVWEWCSDWYGRYSGESVTDPAGPPEGTARVSRGGSWGNPAWVVRLANRVRSAPSFRYRDVGFRVAMRRVIPRPDRPSE